MWKFKISGTLVSGTPPGPAPANVSINTACQITSLGRGTVTHSVAAAIALLLYCATGAVSSPARYILVTVKCLEAKPHGIPSQKVTFLIVVLQKKKAARTV